MTTKRSVRILSRLDDISDNLFKGCVLVSLGALSWILITIMIAFASVFGNSDVPPLPSDYLPDYLMGSLMYFLVYLGFAMMIIGPLIYWILLPIKNRTERKQSEISVTDTDEEDYDDFTQLMDETYGPQDDHKNYEEFSAPQQPPPPEQANLVKMKKKD